MSDSLQIAHLDLNKPAPVQYLMVDDTVQNHLDPKDLINCRGIIVNEFFTPEELVNIEYISGRALGILIKTNPAIGNTQAKTEVLHGNKNNQESC